MHSGCSMTVGAVRVFAVLAFGIFVTVNETAAQTVTVDDTAGQTQVWEDKGYFKINYLYEATSRSIQETFSNSIYGESATYTATHKMGGGGGFDVGAGYRVWQNMAVGLTVTSRSVRDGLSVEGKIPHPLFYNRPRSANLTSANLQSKELGVHLQAVWVVPLSDVIRVALLAGPSAFRLHQGHVSGIGSPTEGAAPYDTVAISGIATKDLRGAGIGFNAGVDVTYLFTERLGGGVFARWAGGNVDLATSGGRQSVKVGGLQTGIGIRAFF